MSAIHATLVGKRFRLQRLNRMMGKHDVLVKYKVSTESIGKFEEGKWLQISANALGRLLRLERRWALEEVRHAFFGVEYEERGALVSDYAHEAQELLQEIRGLMYEKDDLCDASASSYGRVGGDHTEPNQFNPLYLA